MHLTAIIFISHVFNLMRSRGIRNLYQSISTIFQCFPASEKRDRPPYYLGLHPCLDRERYGIHEAPKPFRYKAFRLQWNLTRNALTAITYLLQSEYYGVVKVQWSWGVPMTIPKPKVKRCLSLGSNPRDRHLSSHQQPLQPLAEAFYSFSIE